MNTTELFFNFITSKLKIGRKISLLKSCHQVHCTTSLVPTNFGEKHKLSLSPGEKYVRRFSHLYCKIYQKKKYEHISLVSSVEKLKRLSVPPLSSPWQHFIYRKLASAEKHTYRISLSLKILL